MTSAAKVARKSVYPSLAAFAVSSAASVPFAPGRLSITISRCSPWESRGWRMRATRSVAPPGGKPTMMRIGFEG
jgi:hypothetical protein